MSVIISDKASSVSFLFSNGEEVLLDKDGLQMHKHGEVREYVYITDQGGFVDGADDAVLKLHYTDVTSPVLASNDELITLLLGYKVDPGAIMGSVQITDGTTPLKIEPNGSMPVTLQDQHTPVVIAHFSILEQSTTTTAPVAIGDYVIPLTSVTGVTPGKLLSIFDPASIRFSIANVISVASLNVTIDRPIDFAFPSASYVDVSEPDLAVNGAVTPVVAGIRNNAGSPPPPGIELSMDVTRILFQGITATACDLSLFGDLAALTNGIVCRKRDGSYFNIFNAKTNGDLAGIMYDFQIFDASNPVQGVDGFTGRLTWAGQSKMGVTVRLAIDEDLEMIIQDDLTGISRLEIVAEGSIVQP
jgi:hypothetical protein